MRVEFHRNVSVGLRRNQETQTGVLFSLFLTCSFGEMHRGYAPCSERTSFGNCEEGKALGKMQERHLSILRL